MRQSITPPALGNQSSFHAIPISSSFSSYEDVDSSSSLDDLSGQQDDCDTLPADDVAGEAHAVVVDDATASDSALSMSGTKLRREHLEDLDKSGLSAETVRLMDCCSMDGYDIYRAIYGDSEVPARWNRAHGYSLPYRNGAGKVATRYRMFWAAEDLAADSKMPKYLSHTGADTFLYVPPGFDAAYAASDYLIVTEGEKKAAKAVQEGYPCVAIAGIDMWADSAARKVEKDNHLDMSYATKLLSDLQRLADNRKMIILFDSDAEKKFQIQAARRRLKDALLFQAALWCRQMPMPLPEDGDRKWGLDDLLVHQDGKSVIDAALKAELGAHSESMSPLFKLPYDRQGSRVYSYFIPNYGKHDPYGPTGVFRETPVEKEDGKGGTITLVENKEVSGTRVWLSRVIHSVDGDNDTLYELTYVPHSEGTPKTITGDAELISIANWKDDILARKGARVLPKFKPSLEAFLIDCQKYGVQENKVKKAYGTRRRGWREADEHLTFPAYVMASRIITESETFSAENPKNLLVPIDSGSDEALRQALKVVGSALEWRNAINEHVLNSNVATLVMSAGLAGLLRHWASDTENFILHIYGESSAGKTIALKAAASAWGNPKRLLDTWKATTNGLERKAVGRNDMCLFLDEAGMAEEQELVAAIYALGNGGEKMRATRDAKERTTTKYNLVALSTGEKQLVRGTKFAGQEVRALELRVDVAGPLWPSISGAQSAEAFSRVLDENYGHAVEPMIRGILKMVTADKKAVHHLFERHTEGIRGRIKDTLPQHITRRIKHFGVCLAALEIFLRHVMKWSEVMIEEKMDELAEVIVRRMVQLDTDQFSGGERIAILQHFMNQLAASQNKFLNTSRAGPTPQELYGSIEGSNVFIIPNRLAEMMKPYDKARLVQAAEAVGGLITREAGKRKTISHRMGLARPNCHVFDLDKIEAAIYKDEL